MPASDLQVKSERSTCCAGDDSEFLTVKVGLISAPGWLDRGVSRLSGLETAKNEKNHKKVCGLC